MLCAFQVLQMHQYRRECVMGQYFKCWIPVCRIGFLFEDPDHLLLKSAGSIPELLVLKASFHHGKELIKPVRRIRSFPILLHSFNCFLPAWCFLRVWAVLSGGTYGGCDDQTGAKCQDPQP